MNYLVIRSLTRFHHYVGPEFTVHRVELVGEDAYIHLSLDGHAVLARVPSADRPKPGSTVTIAVRPGDVHLFDGPTGHRVEP